jgi:hypothetical protein
MNVLPFVLAGVLGVGFLGVLLALGRGGEPYRNDGVTVTLRHSALLRWFSIVAVFGGTTGFALAAAIAPPQDAVITWLTTAGVMLLGTFGMALLWESFRWSLTLTPQGLECGSPWKPKRTRTWSDLNRVSYSPLNHWYVLHFTDGGRFRIPTIVPGTLQAVAMCKAKIE